MLKTALGVLVTVITVSPCLAQIATTEPAKPASTTAKRQFYRLDFVLKEVEGTRVVNSRAYVMIVSNEQRLGSIRTGTRIPANNNYVDVGVSIDCHVAEELGNQLSMNIVADISSLADNADKLSDKLSSGLPVIRNNKWSSFVILPLRHPTTLFSSDDLASTRKMQLELTATPIE